MSRSSEQKIRMLVLYDILRKESDEDSPLSTNELIEKLSQYGIAATRHVETLVCLERRITRREI